MRLLIAEDDVDLNDIIVRKLTAEGFLVDACHDGDEALCYLLVADYDVAVLDIMMPKLQCRGDGGTGALHAGRPRSSCALALATGGGTVALPKLGIFRCLLFSCVARAAPAKAVFFVPAHFENGLRV